MNQALLIIEIQNDYFSGGAMELVGSLEAGVQAGRLLHAVRNNGHSVFTCSMSRRGPVRRFLPNTEGVKIHQSVAPTEAETVFQKHHPNRFRETPLLEHLQQHEITQLVIAGMMTQMCVDSTTRAAVSLGFRCFLAHDACATKSRSIGSASASAENVQTAFLAALNGLFAKVQSVEAICATIARPGQGWTLLKRSTRCGERGGVSILHPLP